MQISLNHPLVGKEAHVKMAPTFRTIDFYHKKPKNAVDSAVLILLLAPEKIDKIKDLFSWQVILIRRSSYTGVHSDQIALPGGKKEYSDHDLWETACRETLEEIGISPLSYKKIGKLTDIYVPPSNFIIHPYVAFVTAKIIPQIDPREVADYKFIPINVFNPKKASSLDILDISSGPRRAPAWYYQEYVIWGATAMILSELFLMIAEKKILILT